MSATILRLAAAALPAVAALALAAAPAVAADQELDLSASSPAVEWDNLSVGNGLVVTSDVSGQVPCNPAAYHCESTLLHVADPGTLAVTTAAGNQTTVDIDLHLYDYYDGDPYLLAESTSGGADEAVGADVPEPGDYLVVVDYYLAVDGAYHAKATLTPPATS